MIDSLREFWLHRPVLVTGATGLLGSWTVEELVRRRANVVCFVRDSVPSSRLVSSGLVDQVTVVRGSLENYEDVLRAVNEYEIDTVLHLAAQTIVGTASRSVLSTFESNVRGTWNLLEACRACTSLVRRIVVASSDKAYGSHDQLPYKEDAALDGRYPYDASKACAEIVCRSFATSFDMPIAVTRCGNLFGGGDLNFSRIVPGTIRWALHGHPPVIRSDGTPVRDYFYVEDAVEAYLGLVEHLEDKQLAGEAFNFAAGEPLSVLDVVKRVLKHVGRDDLQPKVMNEASNEIPAQYLDCTKAQEVLGFVPQHGMDEGLTRTVAWYRDWLGIDP